MASAVIPVVTKSTPVGTSVGGGWVVAARSSPSTSTTSSTSTISSTTSSGGSFSGGSHPSTTGVSVIYNNPASGPVTDVKSGIKLQSGEGVVNVNGGALAGGASIRTYFNPYDSNAGFSALATGVAVGQSKQVQGLLQQQVTNQIQQSSSSGSSNSSYVDIKRTPSTQETMILQPDFMKNQPKQFGSGAVMQAASTAKTQGMIAASASKDSNNPGFLDKASLLYTMKSNEKSAVGKNVQAFGFGLLGEGINLIQQGKIFILHPIKTTENVIVSTIEAPYTIAKAVKSGQATEWFAKNPGAATAKITTAVAEGYVIGSGINYVRGKLAAATNPEITDIGVSKGIQSSQGDKILTLEQQKIQYTKPGIIFDSKGKVQLQGITISKQTIPDIYSGVTAAKYSINEATPKDIAQVSITRIKGDTFFSFGQVYAEKAKGKGILTYDTNQIGKFLDSNGFKQSISLTGVSQEGKPIYLIASKSAEVFKQSTPTGELSSFVSIRAGTSGKLGKFFDITTAPPSNPNPIRPETFTPIDSNSAGVILQTKPYGSNLQFTIPKIISDIKAVEIAKVASSPVIPIPIMSSQVSQEYKMIPSVKFNIRPATESIQSIKPGVLSGQTFNIFMRTNTNTGLRSAAATTTSQAAMQTTSQLTQQMTNLEAPFLTRFASPGIPPPMKFNWIPNPDVLGGMLPRSYSQRLIPTGRKFQYTPTATSAEFGIFGKKIQKRLSGLENRPIIPEKKIKKGFSLF